MSNKKDAKKGKLSGTHMPMLAPPLVIDETYKRWYRVASDVLQLPGQYFEEEEEVEPERREGRQKWSNQVEFLMSCIATSVGLGNVWRFAFVAYLNGGGAFLIPYMLVLFLVGKPMYYLECVLGQFSSRNSVRVWSLAPAMKGTGYAQTICIVYILSYYVAIVAMCLYYLLLSFKPTLPWISCDPEWVNCLPSDPSLVTNVKPKEGKSSAELYFIKTVLHQSAGIEGALEAPVWYLALCLFVAWVIIFLIVARGVKSSGKAAYFLAIFPYVVMIILLLTTITLPGASHGILFFITPQWNRILELDVWYAAVTQVFFSLTVGTGPIIMFSSYNSFTSNVHRDSMIVTTLDTCTSLLSGFTIFGILGNLAHVLNCGIDEVVGSGGTGLAFISYPDAIAKTFEPQLFAILFFVMMVVLGIGSAVAFVSTINTVFLDAFPKVHALYITMFNCTLGFICGLVYVTPGGLFVLELVDYYGATFLALFCAITEIVGVAWVYGLENLCLDLEFMLGQKTSAYWRICWGIITPFMMITVFLYALFNFGGVLDFPLIANVVGLFLFLLGVMCVPIFIFLALHREKTGVWRDTVKKAFMPKRTWGPREQKDRRNWRHFKETAISQQEPLRTSKLRHIWLSLTGGYRKVTQET